MKIVVGLMLYFLFVGLIWTIAWGFATWDERSGINE